MNFKLNLLFLAVLPLPLAQDLCAQWGEEIIVANVPATSTSTVFAGDLNGDGSPDLVYSIAPSGGITWYENLAPPGSYQPHALQGTMGSLVVALLDADTDGDLDVLVHSNGQTAWLENDGSGGTWTPHPIANPTAADAIGLNIQCADMDGDGDLDFVSTTLDTLGLGYTSLVLYENQAGQFVHRNTFITSQSIRDFDLGDLDGDGDLDLLNPNLDFDPTPWIRNNSTPSNFSFDWTGSHPISRQPLTTDFDGDGDVDFLQVNSGSISWSENLGAGTFGSPTELIPSHPVPGSTYYLRGEMADMDGDGDEDLVITMRPSNTTSSGTLVRIAWFENLGNSTLGARQDLVNEAFHTSSIGFDLIDFDGDLDLDVIGVERTSTGAGDLLWHRNDHTLGGAVGVLCFPVANSTGASGMLSATGTALVGHNAMALTATGLPANVFGYFLGATQAQNGFTPVGSVGNLCLAGALGRFNANSEIQLSDAGGSFILQLDLTQMPTPFGRQPILAGETRVFQAWHRDPMASTSNFTSAIEVLFE